MQEMIAQPWSHNAMPVENPSGSVATADRFLIFDIGDACEMIARVYYNHKKFLTDFG